MISKSPPTRAGPVSVKKEQDLFPLHMFGPTQGVWFLLLNFSRCPIRYLTYAWSIKYRLITKLIAQFATNLRDKSFKLN